MPILSVIIPAYNEQDNIRGAIGDVFSDIAPVAGDLEVIVIDDGSTDRTPDILRELAGRHEQLVVHSQPNAGHGAALLNGLARARGDWILLLDSDRQVSLAGFGAHWELRDSCDVILGLRVPRCDPAHRTVVSFGMRKLLALITGVRLADAGAPYKLLRRSVWQDARRLIPPDCWIPSVLLAAHAMARRDLNVLETPVVHRHRIHGPSTLNAARLLRFSLMGMRDMIRFARQARRSAPATMKR